MPYGLCIIHYLWKDFRPHPLIKDLYQHIWQNRLGNYIADTNRTNKDDKYLWLDQEDRRQIMADKDIIEWKVNLQESKVTQEQQAGHYD